MFGKLLRLSEYNLEHYQKPTDRSPFGSFLIFLSRGSGNIEKKWSQNEKYENFCKVFINKMPILDWYSDICPTCEQLLKSGMSEYKPEILSELKSVDLEIMKSEKDSWYKYYIPLLKLFENGLYVISCYQYYPTDGEGDFFWGRFETKSVSCSLSDSYYYYDFDLIPHFLVASQNTSMFSKIRLDTSKKYYTKNPGIALHLGSDISLLLDGHHRAMAAAEKGDPFFVVTISEVTKRWESGYSENKIPDHITGIDGLKLKTDSLSYTAKKWLLKSNQKNRELGIVDQFVAISKESNSEFLEELILIKSKLGNYPTSIQLKLVNEIGEITDQIIEGALQRDDSYPSIKQILSVLQIIDKNRARTLAIEILRMEQQSKFWTDSLEVLMPYKDKDILDLFMEMAVKDDGTRDNFTKLINDFMRINEYQYND